jgi:hypothetical protein
MLYRTQSRFERCAEEKNICLCQDSNPSHPALSPSLYRPSYRSSYCCTARVLRADSPPTWGRRSIGSGGESSSMLTSVEGNAVQERMLLWLNLRRLLALKGNEWLTTTPLNFQEWTRRTTARLFLDCELQVLQLYIGMVNNGECVAKSSATTLRILPNLKETKQSVLHTSGVCSCCCSAVRLSSWVIRRLQTNRQKICFWIFHSFPTNNKQEILNTFCSAWLKEFSVSQWLNFLPKHVSDWILMLSIFFFWGCFLYLTWLLKSSELHLKYSLQSLTPSVSSKRRTHVHAFSQLRVSKPSAHQTKWLPSLLHVFCIVLIIPHHYCAVQHKSRQISNTTLIPVQVCPLFLPTERLKLVEIPVKKFNGPITGHVNISAFNWTKILHKTIVWKASI